MITGELKNKIDSLWTDFWTGGITNPINVVFGALTVTLIPVGAAAIGIPSEAQSLVYGLVIIIAVALTISRKRVGVVK
mgnify:CR=1 FL=1